MTRSRIIGTRVSPGFFDLLGVRPVLGRALTEEDDRAGARVVVLNYGFWTRAFGRDPAVIGRTLTLDRQPFTVVGVTGERFVFPPRGPESNGEPAALYLPIAFSPYERQGFGSMYNNSVLARLKPGVTMAQARSDVDAATRTLAERYPAMLRPMAQQLTLPMWPFIEEIVGHESQIDSGPHRRCRHRAADRVCRRREPDADESRFPAARAGPPRRARRQPGVASFVS